MNLYRTIFSLFLSFFSYIYTSSIARKSFEAVCFQTDSTFHDAGNDISTRLRLPAIVNACTCRAVVPRGYSKFKQTWWRPMTQFPLWSLASSNTREISHHYMMTKSRFCLAYSDRELYILKNVCRCYWAPNSGCSAKTPGYKLSHQTRTSSHNQPKAPKLTRWPATNHRYTILTLPSAHGNPDRNWLPS